MPTHFPSGVSNVRKGNPLFGFGMLDPTVWHVYFNDFNTYTAADWTITVVDGGTDSADTRALGNAAGGVLVVTNNDADNDATSFNKVGESFKWVSNKAMFFKARFKVSDATQSDVVFGLQITDTTADDVTDGIFFLKADGAATVSFRVEKNNTASTASAGTLADDTYTTLAFAYDPVAGEFEVFQDDVKVGTVTSTANAPDDEELTISFAVINGEAVAKVLTVDYIFAAVER